MGQYIGTGIQKANKVQNRSGLPFDRCEWLGLRPDPFNLMPIIEHNLKVRRRKHRRGKSASGAHLGMAQAHARPQVGDPLPKLGKRLV